MEELIKEIKKTGNDGAVLFKLDADGNVTHISPLLQVSDMDAMIKQLLSVSDAVQGLINDIFNNTLKDKDRLS